MGTSNPRPLGFGMYSSMIPRLLHSGSRLRCNGSTDLLLLLRTHVGTPLLRRLPSSGSLGFKKSHLMLPNLRTGLAKIGHDR